MTAAKHTPAPWVAMHESNDRLSFRTYVARVGTWWVQPAGDFDSGDQKMDAHLIAAAPELLTALKELVRLAEPWLNEIGEERDAVDAANAAIAKAEGKQ